MSRNVNHDEPAMTSGMPMPSRRQWLRTTLRYGALGGLGLMALNLLGRQDAEQSENACPDALTCHHCRELAQCNRPRAVAFKQKERSHVG